METLNILAQKLEEIDGPIYIAGHINPDNDSIGSCLTLGLALKKLGKEVYVLLEEKDKEILAVHKDHSLVTSEVIHDTYSFIANDLNETYRLGRYEEYFHKAKYTINIDHHQGNLTNADTIVSRPDLSSTCEIIYNLICIINRELLDNNIRESLYAGIMTDTGCFARRLSPNTLNIAQELINSGIDYEGIIRRAYSHRTMYELKALSKLVDNIQFDAFHYVVMDKTLPEFQDLSHNQIVKTIAEEIRKIEGIDIFLLIIKTGNNLHTKCMSNISKNANKIAELFGGGGHKGEAGFSSDKYSVDEVISTTKQFILNNAIEY